MVEAVGWLPSLLYSKLLIQVFYVVSIIAHNSCTAHKISLHAILSDVHTVQEYPGFQILFSVFLPHFSAWICPWQSTTEGRHTTKLCEKNY